MKRLAAVLPAALALFAAGFVPQASGAYPAPQRSDIDPVLADFVIASTAARLSASEEKDAASALPDLLRERNAIRLLKLEDCRWEALDQVQLVTPPGMTSITGYRCRARICIPVAYPTACELQQRIDALDLHLIRDTGQWRLLPDRTWARTIGLELGGCYRRALLALQEDKSSRACAGEQIASR